MYYISEAEAEAIPSLPSPHLIECESDKKGQSFAATAKGRYFISIKTSKDAIFGRREEINVKIRVPCFISVSPYLFRNWCPENVEL